ncbi:MAG: hypothetical protein JO112_20380 [Planctomycetes bacterium]|nr:hypothetical protein [Planctomycetota bacterium]
MTLTYKGITPTLVVDTRPLQNHVPVAGTKWRMGQDGQFTATTGNEGICATLTSFWLNERASGRMVTQIGQFPSAFTLSIAQSGYEASGGQIGSRPALMDRFGLEVITSGEVKRKWYQFKKTPLNSIAAAVGGWPGYYYISIRGDGGHAIGAATKGTVQFFDPNEGILDFANLLDLCKWLPAYVVGEYPDLLKEAELYAAGT